MPHINVYKASKTKRDNVKQTYYIGGMLITLYKNGRLLLAYSTPAKNKGFRLKLEDGTEANKFFKKMIRAT